MRSNGTALVVGLASFPTMPMVTVPAAIYIIFQHLVAGVVKARQMARYRDMQARIFALGKKPLDRYRRVSVIAPLIEGALVFAIAWSMLPDVTGGALSIGRFAFFVTMLQQLATSSADAGGSASMVYENLLYVRHWNELMALPRLIPMAERPHRFATVRAPRIEFRNVSFAYPSVVTHAC